MTTWTIVAAVRGASDVALVAPRSSSVPQSASGTWTFALAVTGWPSATRPVIVEVPTSPVAPARPAAAPARTDTADATISPPSTVTPSARTEPSAEDDVPGCAVTEAVEAPMRSTEPSAGKANEAELVPAGGPVSCTVPPDACPGTLTWATSAVAPVRGVAGPP